MTIPRSAVAALAVTVALCGCRRDAKTSAPPPEKPADAGPEPDKPPPTSDRRPEITLLDPGAEPHAELRYALAAGKSEKLTLTMSYSAENRVQAAAPQRLKFPGMKMVFKVEVVEATADGARYEFELTDTGLTDTGGADATLVKMAGAGLKKAIGMRGSAVVDARGFIRDGQLEIPAGLDPNMRVMMESMKSSMEQLSSPLPSEPLGEGARWQLSQTVAQAGVSLEQVTTYALSITKKDGRLLTGEIRQRADRQEVDLPGVDKAELIELEATGKSELELDLERLAPRRGTIEIESKSQLEITVGEQTRGLISRGTLKLEIAGQ